MAIAETLDKVERDMESGDLGKARDRLHGLLSTYPNNLEVRRRLGDVYWHLQYPAMAGRYWYLEQDKTPEMEAACRVFEGDWGSDPLEILKALKFQGDIEAIRGTFAGDLLLTLRQQAQERHGHAYCFRTARVQYRVAQPAAQPQVRRPPIRARWLLFRWPRLARAQSQLYRVSPLPVGCWLALAVMSMLMLATVGLMIAGLIAVFQWTF